MLDTDDPALWYALNRLIINYWADVDDNGGGNAHEFYVPEAVYTVGNNRFEGAEKIRSFYARRRQHGTISTRHLVGNLQIFREDERRARAVGVMSLYRADGPPPIERMRPPSMIADFEARLKVQQTALQSQFAAADRAISALNSQGSKLTSLLASLASNK